MKVCRGLLQIKPKTIEHPIAPKPPLFRSFQNPLSSTPMPGGLISAWILEFVLRQPIEDQLANEIFYILPISLPLSPRLNRTILLRRLASELSRHVVSERTLHTLELLHDLDRSPDPPESLYASYCAVAVECTASTLRARPPDDTVGFFGAVNRIWNCRVADLERSKAAGLVSDGLKRARKDMEEAIEDSMVRDALSRRETKKEALEAVAVYLSEEYRKMGPPFLELVAGAISQTRTGGMDPSLVELEEKLANSRMENRPELPRKAGGISTNIFDRLPTPEVMKVREELRTSCLGLQTLVSDPLPDAIKMAAEVTRKISGEMDGSRKNMNHAACPGEEGNGASVGQDKDNGVVPEPIAVEQNISHVEGVKGKGKIGDLDASSSGAGDVGGQFDDGDRLRRPSLMPGDVDRQTSNGDGTQKPSLMVRNPTARTYEWDDSIDSSSNESQRLMEKPHLPSLKRQAISPLKILGNRDLLGRRRAKRWSTLEEETLRKAVQRYGKGKWKFIKNCHPEIFEDRTEVDLKDKWRNMCRR